MKVMIEVATTSLDFEDGLFNYTYTIFCWYAIILPTKSQKVKYW